MNDVDESDQADDAGFADIEWELCCSTREASLAFTPSANLDFMKQAMDLRRSPAKRPRS